MRSRMRPSAASSANRVHVMTVTQPLARALVGEVRPALLEESADALGALRPHRVRGDGLALEHHLRLPGAGSVRLSNSSSIVRFTPSMRGSRNEVPASGVRPALV